MGIAREEAADSVIELIEVNVSDFDEMQAAAASLIAQDIDAFLIFTGLTVDTDFETLARVAEENQIPLFADDPFLAERGAAVAIGVDYYYDGALAGRMAAQILAGLATPADFTIKPPRANLFFVNLVAGDKQLVEFPVYIVERADEVISSR
jgi:putative ABC transport system substrate-binding protein